MSNQLPKQPDAARALCLQFNVDLPAYLEGESRPEVESHARQCPFCSAVLEDLQLIQSQAAHLLLEDPPARVWANVRATLAAEGVFREPAPAWLRWLPQTGLLRYAAPFAAMACMVLIGTLFLVRPPSSTPVIDSIPGTARGIVPPGAPFAASDLMEKEPGNALAQEYLTSAYQQKAAVLSAALEYDGQ